MKRFWYSTVAGAVTAMVFWAIIVGQQGPGRLRPKETPSRAVLMPRDVAGWMRGPVAAGQPAWITEAPHVAR